MAFFSSWVFAFAFRDFNVDSLGIFMMFRVRSLLSFWCALHRPHCRLFRATACFANWGKEHTGMNIDQDTRL